jgi:hypothetical protein
VRSVAPVATTSTEPEHPTYQSDQLTGASWIQGAQEVDELIGRVEVVYPPLGTCTAKQGSGGNEFNGALNILFRINGAVVARATYGPESAGYKGGEQTRLILPLFTSNAVVGAAHGAYFGELLEGEGPVWEPGTDTVRVLTAEVADGCGYGGGNASEHFTIKSITIDVLGSR